MADPIDYGAHATADSAPINYGAHSAADQPGPISRFFSALDPRPLVNQILKPSDDPDENRALTVAKNVKGIVGNLMDAQQRERDAMHKSWNEGDHKSAIAHGLAALTPVLGPMSQDAADKINSGDVAGGLGTLTAMAAPELIKGGIAAVPAIGEAGDAALTAAKAAVKAGGRDVAVGAAKGAAGAAVAHVPVPGAGVAGALIDYGAGKQVLRGIKAGARAAGSASKDDAAVQRVAAGFDPATAEVQTSPGQAPVAGPVGLPGPLGAGSWAIPGATAMEGPTTGTGAASVAANVKPIAADPLLTRAAASRPAIPQSGLTAIPPEPAPKMQGAIPYDLTQNPDIAKGLPEGVQRAMPDGKTQTLTRVPIDDLAFDPGNTIYPDRVDEYQKNGYAVHPELRMNDLNDPTIPEKFVVKEGHHRILSDVKNGKDSVLAWTPDAEEAQAEPAPKANVIPFKNAEADAAKSAEMETNGRAAKTQTLAQSLHENGLTHDQLSAMPPAKLKATLSDLTKALKINKTGNLSDASVSQTLFELKSLERAQSVSPELLKKLQDSGALKTAQDLARRMQP